MITRYTTSNIDRYTEGYYYIANGKEYSQDELRAAGLTTQSGNGTIAQALIRTGVLVPRLYTDAEIRSWNNGRDYMDSQVQDPLTGDVLSYTPGPELDAFLSRVPSQYRLGGSGVFTSLAAPTSSAPPPPVLGGMYDVDALWAQPSVIPSDPIRAGDMAMFGSFGSPAPSPTFSASTNELDRFRVLFLIIGIAIGVYLIAD
jgi:hypothetical protein